MEVTQHARYTCTFCGKASAFFPSSQQYLTVEFYRIPSSVAQSAFGIAVPAKRRSLVVLGLYRQLRLLQCGGERRLHAWLDISVLILA